MATRWEISTNTKTKTITKKEDRDKKRRNVLLKFYELNTFAGGLDAVLALPGTEDLQGSSSLVIFGAGSQVFESSDQTEREKVLISDPVLKNNLTSGNVIKLLFDKRGSSNRPPSGYLYCIRLRGEYMLHH